MSLMSLVNIVVSRILVELVKRSSIPFEFVHPNV